MVKILETYYKVNNNIINSYNINKRNYHNLQNLNYLKSNTINDKNSIILYFFIELLKL